MFSIVRACRRVIHILLAPLFVSRMWEAHVVRSRRLRGTALVSALRALSVGLVLLVSCSVGTNMPADTGDAGSSAPADAAGPRSSTGTDSALRAAYIAAVQKDAAAEYRVEP